MQAITLHACIPKVREELWNAETLKLVEDCWVVLVATSLVWLPQLLTYTHTHTTYLNCSHTPTHTHYVPPVVSRRFCWHTLGRSSTLSGHQMQALHK